MATTDKSAGTLTAADWGLLILRVGLGVMFVFHGHAKMFSGPGKWAEIGHMAMPHLGIHFAPEMWGFLAAFAEFFGGVFVLLGLATRLYAFLLAITMVVAATTLLSNGADLTKASQPIELCVVFLSLIFLGSGRISLEYMLRTKAQ
jgi:putative oxidoreductase